MSKIEDTYFKMLEGNVDATIKYAEYVAEQGGTKEAYDTIIKLSDESFGEDYEGLKNKYRIMGKLLMKMEKYEDAVTAFENVTELGGNDILADMTECYAFLGWDLSRVETLIENDNTDMQYIIACAYAGKYNVFKQNAIRAKLYFDRIKSNNPNDTLLLAKCDSWLAYINCGDKTCVSADTLKTIQQGSDAGDEECIAICREIEQRQRLQEEEKKAAKMEKAIKNKELFKSKGGKIVRLLKAGFYKFTRLSLGAKIIVILVLYSVIGAIVNCFYFMMK